MWGGGVWRQRDRESRRWDDGCPRCGRIHGRGGHQPTLQLNLGVSVFIYVTLKNHDGDSLTDFENAVQSIDEIVECHTTSGEKDYLLKVIVESIEEYEFLLKTKLTHLPLVDHVSSTFALKQVKNTTELPIKRQ